MVHKEKNRKTKLPQLGIIIKWGGYLAGLTVVIGLLYSSTANISTILGVYLGCKALLLVMRLFSMVFAVILTLFFILILIVIITLLIF